MLDKTIEILKPYVEDDIAITLDSSLVNDLGLSSLDVISVAGEFEEEFDIEIPDRVIPTLSTVGDIVSFLESYT